jgi:hypothetical protein
MHQSDVRAVLTSLFLGASACTAPPSHAFLSELCTSTTSGGTLTTTVTLTNEGDQGIPLSVEPTCPLMVSLIVTDGGRGPIPNPTVCFGARREVAPGESLTLEGTRDAQWLSSFEPGNYLVEASFTELVIFRGSPTLVLDFCGNVALPLQ